jgi:Putative transmembrane protein (PGPGW)
MFEPPDWLHWGDAWVAWIFGISLFTLAISALLVPILVRRMPADYFLENRPITETIQARHPVGTVLIKILKSLLGALLILAGLIMLIIPGQGILTILVGLILMDFPGKKAIERKLIQLPPLWKAIHWIRHRAGREDLQLPAPAEKES